MRVKTIRQHLNNYGPVPIKNVGRKYEVSDRIGQALIGAGVVVEDVKATDAAEG